MRIILFILTMFCSTFMIGQNSVADLSEDGKQNLLQRSASFTTVNSQQLLQQVADRNQVFIQQVGENNVAITNVTSSKSKVVIDQEGSDNTVFSFYSAGTINSEIVQRGNSNSFFETVAGGQLQEVNSLNSQTGNNLTLNKFGSNSISNNISINMTGNNKTMTVISL